MRRTLLPSDEKDTAMQAIALRPAGGTGLSTVSGGTGLSTVSGGTGLGTSSGGSGPNSSADGAGGFFGLAAQRLAYIDQRQRVLAQNIANADTPHYRAHDLSPFEKMLRLAPVTTSLTDPAHLRGTTPTAGLILQPVADMAPDGNGVDVEAELTKVAQDETSASLVSNLWKTTMGMYLTALGRGG